jgi:hypothetical protein
MRAREFTEALNRPYYLHWEHSTDGDVSAVAELPANEGHIHILFEPHRDNKDGSVAWEVEFWRNDSQDITGEGDEFRVFATALQAVFEFVAKYKPMNLSFQATKKVDQGQKPLSRANLYDTLVQRHARASGYRAFRADAGNNVHYELVKINKDVSEGSLREIDYAYELDSGTIDPDKLLKSGKTVGNIEGNDVVMLSKGNQTVYMLKVDNTATAFIGFEGENLKNIKNFTQTPGVIRALIGFLVHKKNMKIKISPNEPLTNEGLKWISRLINDPRGLKIKDQAGNDIDITQLNHEWQLAKKSGTAGKTQITISENTQFGNKLRENEAKRKADSLLMPVNFYSVRMKPQAAAEGAMKDLDIDIQDQQWDAIVGYVVNGVNKGMDTDPMELALYKWASRELVDVEQALEDHGFRDIADLADHIEQHDGRYVPPSDFGLGNLGGKSA